MNRVRLLALILVSFLALPGCASIEALTGEYGDNYALYTAACSKPENQKNITVPQADGSTISIAQGCTVAPPVDNVTPLLAAGITAGGNLIGTGFSVYFDYKQTKAVVKSNENVMEAAFGAAGDRYNTGDRTVIGADNTQNDGLETVPFDLNPVLAPEIEVPEEVEVPEVVEPIL